MTELLLAAGSGLLWLAAFAAVTLLVARWFPDEPGPTLLAAYPLFCAAQVLVARLASALGLLTSGAFLVLYAALAVTAAALWIARGPAAPAQPLGGDPGTANETDPDIRLVRRVVLGCAAAVLAGLLLFALVSPVHVWDVLAYHLPMVASYIQNGSLDAWPTQDLRQVFRVNAGELQMLHVALPARSDALVELPNLLGLAVLLVGTLELARLEYGRTALPWLAVAIVLTAPQVLVGAATGKNDLLFVAVVIAAFYWMVRAGLARDGRTTRCIALAALSAAVAAATKVMGLNVLGAVGLLALVLAARRRLPFRAVLQFGVVALLALLALAGDVYWKNFSRSVVPVGISPGEISYTFGPGNITAAARFYLYDLPVRRLLTPQLFEHDFLHYGYLFPVLLAAGCVVAFRQLRERRFVLASLALIGAALFVSVIALRLPIQWDQRFMIWMVPTLAILALSLARRWAPRALVAATAAAASLALVQLALTITNESDGLFMRSAQHLAGTGTLARHADVPNPRYTAMGAGFAALDAAAGPRDSVLYAGTDDSWMYPAWGARFSRYVVGVDDAEQAAAQVRSGRFRFIVVENEAREPIRRAIATTAAGAGYRTLQQADGRVIFVRAITGATRTPSRP